MNQTVAKKNGAKRATSNFEDSRIWRLKLRLQFTGWLQYIPNALIALIFLLVAAAGWMIGAWPLPLFWLPFGIGCLLFAVLIFDITTVKFGLRPIEALPKRREDMGAFDLMRVRRSCRSFQPRNLIASDHAELMESVRTHSQTDLQLGTRPIRFEYIAAPLTVWPVVGCGEFLVAIAPHEYDRLAVVDVGRSLQKVVLDATRMGLATCWIGPGADQKSIAKKLGNRFNPDEDHIICVCAVGYSSFFKPTTLRVIQLSQRHRLPLTSLFFSDPHFQEPLDVDAHPFDSFGRCCEVCQWSPSSFNEQTTRCVAVMEQVEGEERLARFDFFAATTSRYYAAVALGIWCANWETGCEALGKKGHFSILTPAERGIQEPSELPRYDVSWVVANLETEQP
jgi:nitroreductase